MGKTQKRQTSEKSRRESGPSPARGKSPGKAIVGGRGLDSEENALEMQACGVGQARGGAAETSALAKLPVGRFGQACLPSQGPGQGALLAPGCWSPARKLIRKRGICFWMPSEVTSEKETPHLQNTKLRPRPTQSRYERKTESKPPAFPIPSD